MDVCFYSCGNRLEIRGNSGLAGYELARLESDLRIAGCNVVNTHDSDETIVLAITVASRSLPLEEVFQTPAEYNIMCLQQAAELCKVEGRVTMAADLYGMAEELETKIETESKHVVY